MGPLVAGVDCSTQETKVAVVDPESGRLLALGRSAHTVTGNRGARESDPRQWWTAMADAFAQTRLAREIGAISVAGQQHGLVCLDEHGEALRPAILWNDVRPAAQAAALVDSLGPKTWAQLTGGPPIASFTVAKWVWLRENEPWTAAATKAIRLPHDYLTERLTGHGITDRGDASGTGWWDTRSERYAPEVLELPSVEIDVDLLPRVLAPTELAGEVLAPRATELGLRSGVVVGPGTGDNMGAALGLGVGIGQPVVSLGTSGTAYAVSPCRSEDPTGVVAGFADATGRFLPLACTLNCTLSVDLVAGWFGLGREDVAESDDVVFLPWFDGERTPNLPNATARLTGVRQSTTPRQILMAAYEGAAASLLAALDKVAEQAGGTDPSAPLVLIGGGARGQTWRNVVGRLSGRALLIPSAGELVALGAAVQAAAALSGEDPISIATRWNASNGILVEAVARDDERVERIAAACDAMVAATRGAAVAGRYA